MCRPTECQATTMVATKTIVVVTDSVGPVRHSTINEPINTLVRKNNNDHCYRSNNNDQPSNHGRVHTRHIVLFLCMLTNAISYTMRTNINMTIVAMVTNDPNATEAETCLTASSSSVDYSHSSPYSSVITLNQTFPPSLPRQDEAKDGIHYDWSESLQGTILGAFYYGYIVTMALAGQLADYFGAKRLIFISVLTCSICTLAVPLSAHMHPYLVVTVRILTGLAQGVVTPALYTILPHWTPKNELGLAFGLIAASGNLGAVLTMPICGFLAEYGFAGGWPSVFYVFGTVALLFLPLWVYCVYDSPDQHPWITSHERVYIQMNLSISSSSSKRKALVPWRAILTSPKVWAIAVSRFCNAWGYLFLMSKLPAYLKSVLHMPITYNGYVNSSIYIALGGSTLVWGAVSDYVERRQLIGRTASRKLFQSCALCGGALFLAFVPLVGCNVIAIVVLLNLSMITLGLIAGGESLIVVDVAPDYSGSIYGLTNAVASLPGFLAPLFVGILLDQSSSANVMLQWNILFWISSAIFVFGALVFVLGVNANPEQWAQQQQQQNATTWNSNLDSMEKSKNDYQKSSPANQVNIDINNNDDNFNGQSSGKL